jgi:hypothetical protein
MTESAQAATIDLPEEVRKFVREQGLEERLPAVLEMTRAVFPGCEPSVELENDRELPERYLVVNVVRVDLDVPQAVKARKAWCRGLRAACPGPEAYLVRLRLAVSG